MTAPMRSVTCHCLTCTTSLLQASPGHCILKMLTRTAALGYSTGHCDAMHVASHSHLLCNYSTFIKCRLVDHPMCCTTLHSNALYHTAPSSRTCTICQYCCNQPDVLWAYATAATNNGRACLAPCAGMLHVCHGSDNAIRTWTIVTCKTWRTCIILGQQLSEQRVLTETSSLSQAMETLGANSSCMWGAHRPLLVMGAALVCPPSSICNSGAGGPPFSESHRLVLLKPLAYAPT